VLKFYNSLTRKLEEFSPADPNHVKMYVCGPTVYDRPHLGNARSVVIYDVLYRLLKSQYKQVTYVRNITDVDDKIINAAKENKESIASLTARVTKDFHEDMAALNCELPTHEPKATENIPAMIQMIEKLIKNGYAYVIPVGEKGAGHVLFNVGELEYRPAPGYFYGKLSGKDLKKLDAGKRVDVEKYKSKNPEDFVLWKPADAEDDESSKFQSPWGVGRPGWHIECSAMSTGILGNDFDIHGGGADLMFPHHENEIAQSCCANPGSHYAKFWVHNAFLTVNGEKMAKSEGNFITVRDLLDKGVKGEVIRFALLSSHYHSPLNWTEKLLYDAKVTLDNAYRALLNVDKFDDKEVETAAYSDLQVVNDMLCNDLNMRGVISDIYKYTDTLIARYTEIINLGHTNSDIRGNIKYIARKFREAMRPLGFLQQSPEDWFRIDNPEIDELKLAIQAARERKDYAAADKNKAKIEELGYKVMINKDGEVEVLKK